MDKCVKSNIIMQQNSDRSVREQEERNREQTEKERQRERERERGRERERNVNYPLYRLSRSIWARLFSTERTIVEINR